MIMDLDSVALSGVKAGSPRATEQQDGTWYDGARSEYDGGIYNYNGDFYGGGFSSTGGFRG